MDRNKPGIAFKLGKDSARTLIPSLLLSFSAALSIPLFKMASDHGALDYEGKIAFQWALYLISWPVTVLEKSVSYVDHLFYNSHAQGASFWMSFLEYVFVNFAGWTLLLAIALRTKKILQKT